MARPLLERKAEFRAMGMPTAGTNLLTACGGVFNSGTVNPADAFSGDNAGTCIPAAPAPLFVSCEVSFGVVFEAHANGD